MAPAAGLAPRAAIVTGQCRVDAGQIDERNQFPHASRRGKLARSTRFCRYSLPYSATLTLEKAALPVILSAGPERNETLRRLRRKRASAFLSVR
jgi:hypothetical protein